MPDRPPLATRPTWPGLTNQTATARLAAEGANLLPREAPRTPWRLLGEVLREPMFLLLLAAAAIYVALGDLTEGLTLLGAVVVVISITLVQARRSDRALHALADLSSPRAQVLRDGQVVTLPARALVRGDIIRLAEGDRVPADVVLREGTEMAVDESMLTGESVSIAKTADAHRDATATPPGTHAAAMYAGTMVLAGRGLAEVVATGATTELGRIGASLKELRRDPTPLQRQIGVMVRAMAIVGLVASGLLVGLLGTTHGDWLQACLSGITLAMALLPEEFPVVLTVFLALGAWRIAKHRVLTRQVMAIEALGAMHILCTDKTGTLTQNRMTIARLWTDDAALTLAATALPSSLPESVHELAEYGILACPRDPFDPMEKAFLALGAAALARTEHLHPAWRLLREYPLTPQLLAVTHAWRAPDAPATVVATKGAPEAVFELCHLPVADANRWRQRVEAMARDGLRVLAVARSKRALEREPAHPHDVDFELLGLVGLADPLRDDVPGAVALCHRAKIRVVMITGDHPETARAIAQAAGIVATPAAGSDAGGDAGGDVGGDVEILLGRDMEGLGDAELAARLATVRIIARAVPAHKLRIVRVLRAQGAVIGMTGDGLNDAPALKAADIGIAMGARGTEVAREAASLVLVQDDFASIVHAVALGRRIYDNIQKAIGYIVAVHVPIAGLALLPALLGWPPLLLPLHVVIFELIIDPAASVVFEMEPAETDVMDRPPRALDATLFGWPQLVWSLAQGGLILLAGGFIVWLGRDAGVAEPALRAMAFACVAYGNVAILLANRRAPRAGWRPPWSSRNPAVAILIGATTAALAVLLLVPSLREIVAFGPLTPAQAAIAILAGAGPVGMLAAARRLIAR